MTAFHLTDPAIATALRDTLEAGRDECVTIVEGDWPKQCPLADPTDCNGEHCDCPLRPPERFRVLDKPCDTCDGYEVTGVDGKEVEPGGRLIPCPNPECWRGRQVWEITITCPSNDCENGWLWDDRSIPHAPCDGSGRVVLCKATITVVPVVSDDDCIGDAAETSHICVQDHLAIYWDGGRFSDDVELTLDPLPVPGRDFGIIWKITS